MFRSSWRPVTCTRMSWTACGSRGGRAVFQLKQGPFHLGPESGNVDSRRWQDVTQCSTPAARLSRSGGRADVTVWAGSHRAAGVLDAGGPVGFCLQQVSGASLSRCPLVCSSSRCRRSLLSGATTINVTMSESCQSCCRTRSCPTEARRRNKATPRPPPAGRGERLCLT